MQVARSLARLLNGLVIGNIVCALIGFVECLDKSVGLAAQSLLALLNG